MILYENFEKILALCLVVFMLLNTCTYAFATEISDATEVSITSVMLAIPFLRTKHY